MLIFYKNNASQQQFGIQSGLQDVKSISKMPEQIQQGEAFNQAANIVLSTVVGAETFMNLGAELNQAVDPSDYEYEDGVFTWEYSHTVEGVAASIRYEAEPNDDANEVDWRLYVTSQSEEMDIEDELFMSGTTSMDEASGDWEVRDVTGTATTNPVLTFDWMVDENDNLTTSLNINADGESVSIDYEEDGTTRTLSFTMSSQQYDVVVTWDSDTGAGSITINGDPMCWNASFEDAACQ